MTPLFHLFQMSSATSHGDINRIRRATARSRTRLQAAARRSLENLLSLRGDMQVSGETSLFVCQAARSQGWFLPLCMSLQPGSRQWLSFLWSFLLLAWELWESYIKYILNTFLPLGAKQRVLAMSISQNRGRNRKSFSKKVQMEPLITRSLFLLCGRQKLKGWCPSSLQHRCTAWSWCTVWKAGDI